MSQEDLWGFPGGPDSKESACNVGDLGFTPGSGIFPWRREWLPTPVFLPRESHGQRSLEGGSPWGHKVWDMTEATNNRRIFKVAKVCQSSLP